MENLTPGLAWKYVDNFINYLEGKSYDPELLHLEVIKQARETVKRRIAFDELINSNKSNPNMGALPPVQSVPGEKEAK